MVWIGHCSNDNGVTTGRYQPPIAPVVWTNNPKKPCPNKPSNSGSTLVVVTANSNDDRRHCVGISLGALIGIIIGVFLFAGLLWIIVRYLKKRKTKGGDADGGGGGGGEKPRFTAKTKGAVSVKDLEKGGMRVH